MSVLKELQALDEMLNPKEGRPLIGGITIHSGSEFITRILVELEKNQRPVCEWTRAIGQYETACEAAYSCLISQPSNFCPNCGGKVGVV